MRKEVEGPGGSLESPFLWVTKVVTESGCSFDVFPSFSFAIAVANKAVNLTEGIPYIR